LATAWGAGHPSEYIVAGPEYFGYLRALKVCLRGDLAEAKREGMAAFVAYKDTSRAKAGVAAFLSLVSGDAAGFRENLEKRLVTHKKQYQWTPNDPVGVVFLHGMALCRLAIVQGIEVEEGPYHSTTVSPNPASC
jgi:hypothetical protein